MTQPVKKPLKRILVNLSRKKLFAYEGNQLVYEFQCTSGREGKETDVGKFLILRKQHPYRSKTYDVQMDYAMFFTRDGKAIHKSTNVTLRSFAMWLGITSVGSHGCVGLIEENAKSLYEWAPVGTVVEVIEDTAYAENAQ